MESGFDSAVESEFDGVGELSLPDRSKLDVVPRALDLLALVVDTRLLALGLGGEKAGRFRFVAIAAVDGMSILPVDFLDNDSHLFEDTVIVQG